MKSLIQLLQVSYEKKIKLLISFIFKGIFCTNKLNAISNGSSLSQFVPMTFSTILYRVTVVGKKIREGNMLTWALKEKEGYALHLTNKITY